MTPTLPRLCATAALRGHSRHKRVQIGRCMMRGAARKLHGACLNASGWAEQDSNLRRRKPTDLQSVPVGRLGICPGTAIAVIGEAAPSVWQIFSGLSRSCRRPSPLPRHGSVALVDSRHAEVCADSRSVLSRAWASNLRIWPLSRDGGPRQASRIYGDTQWEWAIYLW